MDAWMQSLMHWLALPQVGLSTVFVVALISATLLPIGSEPAVAAYVLLEPTMFWPTVLAATAGNTIGGGISWWMGYGAERAYEHARHRAPHEVKALAWLRRFGPKACLLSWLPVVGDPICALAGWLKLPFWPCLGSMAIGKFARYLTMTWLIVGGYPTLSHWWHAVAGAGAGG